MRKELALLALALGCAAPPDTPPPCIPTVLAEEPKPPASDREMTCEDCVQAAQANHRGLRMADRRVLIAEDRLDEAWATTFPKLLLEGRYQSRNNDPGASIGGRETITGERRGTTGRASLIVPIYDFGTAEQRDAERMRVDTAGDDAARARDQAVLAVMQAYYRVLEAGKIRSVVEDSIKTVERQAEIARDFHAQGMVARNDVLTAEVQLAERRQDLIRAENNVQLAVATLNRVMGFDVDRPTRIADVLDAVPWNGAYVSALRTAIENRADLRALKRQVEIARAEYKALRGSGTMPRVYGFGDYNYASDDYILNNDWLVGGVVVQFPLFDGGVIWARLNQADKLAANAADARDERVDDIVLDVKRAYLNVREAAERIPVAKQAVALAEENLRIVRDQYAEGLVSSADVLFEEDRLSRSRSNSFRALYDYHSSFAQLVNAIGGTPPEE